MKVGIAGFGNVGRSVASSLLRGSIPGAELVAVAARDLDRARPRAAQLDPGLRVVPLTELVELADIVIEAATGEALPEIATATLRAGKELICISAGGLLDMPDIERFARTHGGRLQIASGTMPGLDLLRSSAEGSVSKVHLKSRLRVGSLSNEPYVLAAGHDFSAEPPASAMKVFEGSARDAAKAFPRHLNVAVALSLAGIGLDRTTIELWVDPDIPGAVNRLEIEAEDVSLSLESRNRPSDNPKTSRIVAPSILAALRTRTAVMRVGS